MKIGNKLTYKKLLDLNDTEVYVKNVCGKSANQPTIKCTVRVVAKYPDEIFDWESLGYTQERNEDEVLDKFFRYHKKKYKHILLENSENQFIFDFNGKCIDGEFEVYQLL